MEDSTVLASSIKALDKTSVHRISSGQVVVDLQTAVKELVENSLDAGATSVEVRFKQYGLLSVEVVDNGCGIDEKDWDSVGLKHYTSKLATFDDLSTVRTFGFRGEALSSLCALCEGVTVTTTTNGPMGIQLDLEKSGRVGKRTKVARQRGTTVHLENIFAPLPVRRKELQRNLKREFAKALGLLNAYALGPCAGMDSSGRGVRLTVTNQTENGQKAVQIKTNGVPSFKVSLTALWGPKSIENTVELDLNCRVQQEKSALRRIRDRYTESQASQTQGHSRDEDDGIPIQVKGLVSKFSIGAGRTGTDRQFFYVNGRPCNLTKVQKAFNEVYRTFNANQAPFILANFVVPTECCDINVSPDKRTIFLQSEGNLIDALKTALEAEFSSHRSTFNLNPTQFSQSTLMQTTFDSPFSKRLKLKAGPGLTKSKSLPVSASSRTIEKRSELEGCSGQTLFLPESEGSEGEPPAVAKWNRKEMLEEGSGRHMLRTEEGVAEEEARATNNETADVAICRAVDDKVPMDIDEEGKRETVPKRIEKGIESSVVLDTTRASWGSKSAATASATEKLAGDLSGERDADIEEPEVKKRKMQAGGLELAADAAASKPSCKPSSRRSAELVPLDSLRNRFARLSRGNVHAPATSSKNALRVVDEMDTGQEEAEVTKPSASDGKKRRDRSPVVEVIKLPSAKLPKSRKAKQARCDTEKIPTDSNGDAIMDLDSSTSSTIDVSESSAAKVVEADDERHTLFEMAVERPEVIRNVDTALGNVTLRFDLERLSSAWARQRKGPVMPVEREVSSMSGKIPADAGMTNTQDNESAARALGRVIDKSDFADMDIIGQFNRGFIVVRRKRTACDRREQGGSKMDDLFIVDQHASDEKYNFEMLQQTTRVESQVLFKPRALELTAADELVAVENIHAVQQNGFELEVDETAPAGQGSKLKVIAFPVSKSTEFDMTDLEELIHLMRDQPSGSVVRCSKVRAMFAMRACRKSVMIGMPLSKNQMMTVVQHMGMIDQPWNCPHGRPTMRHLLDLCRDDLQCQPRTLTWFSLGGI